MYPSESYALLRRATLQAYFYARAEENHDHTFLPRIIADGLAANLPKIILEAKMLPECDGETGVLHIGSIKLAHYGNYRETGHSRFGIQTVTAVTEKNHAQGVSLFFFHNPAGDLLVEFTAMMGYGEPRRFELNIPETHHHPLNLQLNSLRHQVRNAFADGQVIESRLTVLTDWARKQ